MLLCVFGYDYFDCKKSSVISLSTRWSLWKKSQSASGNFRGEGGTTVEERLNRTWKPSPSKIPVTFFAQIDKLILKFIQKFNQPSIAKTM